MPEIREAQEILKALGMPPAQQNEMAALTLLALCGLKPEDKWLSAKRQSLTLVKGIMYFISDVYKKPYRENTRESIRKQALHQFVQGRIADLNPDDPTLPTNSPSTHYAISDAALAVVRTHDSPEWDEAVKRFKVDYGTLASLYATSREAFGVPVQIPDGTKLTLSPGKHNQLQAQVIELFAPQFASGAQLLYLGDTADKDLYVATEQLVELGIPVTEHDKLPDIILYLPAKNWLYLIEAVTSHGPMSPKRILELNVMLKDCTVGKVFVTAFATFAEFRRHMKNIAWETEVWVSEVPDHLIHFNGDRFLGPRE
jgi:hypothetical protein